MTGLAPMCERRPPWMEEAIAAAAQDQPEAKALAYHLSRPNADELATYDNGTFTGYGRSDDIFQETAAAIGRQPEVLVLGAGLGTFMLRLQTEKGLSVQGVSDIDYSTLRTQLLQDQAGRRAKIPHLLTDGSYLVGDVHHLADIKGIRLPTDVIVSRGFFERLPDPLSVLEQAANAVRRGGKVAIDSMALAPYSYDEATAKRLMPNFTTSLILDALQNSGFRCAHLTTQHTAKLEEQVLMRLVLHKQSDETLRLPVGYEQVDAQTGTWRYVSLGK